MDDTSRKAVLREYISMYIAVIMTRRRKGVLTLNPVAVTNEELIRSPFGIVTSRENDQPGYLVLWHSNNIFIEKKKPDNV